jgi:iodotyrosine deiodinase
MNSSEYIDIEVESYTSKEMIDRSRGFYHWLNNRRSFRTFSDKAVPLEVMENIILSAGTAPSGAHKQPWNFCLIGNSEIKSKIRKAAEQEEYENYNGRMSKDWLKDLEVFETDWNKDFLEIAPWLIVVCKKTFDLDETGKKKNYYVNESVGLASGMLLTAIHNAGLVALTHTPSPMNFLTSILDRPVNEKPFLLIPVGYPIDKPKAPNLNRKSINEIMTIY